MPVTSRLRIHQVRRNLRTMQNLRTSRDDETVQTWWYCHVFFLSLLKTTTIAATTQAKVESESQQLCHGHTLRMRNLQSCKFRVFGQNRGHSQINIIFCRASTIRLKALCRCGRWECVCGVYGICNNVCMARFRLKIMLCLPTVSTKNSSENFFLAHNDNKPNKSCQQLSAACIVCSEACYCMRVCECVCMCFCACLRVLPCTGNMCQLMVVSVGERPACLPHPHHNNGAEAAILLPPLTPPSPPPHETTQHNHLSWFLFRRNQHFSLFRFYFFVVLFLVFSRFFCAILPPVLQVEVYFVNMPLKVFYFPLKYSNQTPTPAWMCRVLVSLNVLPLRLCVCECVCFLFF